MYILPVYVCMSVVQGAICSQNIITKVVEGVKGKRGGRGSMLIRRWLTSYKAAPVVFPTIPFDWLFCFGDDELTGALLCSKVGSVPSWLDWDELSPLPS